MSPEKVIFRSQHSRMCVNFPPNKFGFGNSEELERDDFNRIVRDSAGNPIRRQVLKPRVQFMDGVVALDPEADAATIADLRKHANFSKTGPQRGMFWEDTSAETALRRARGEVVLHVQLPLSDEDAGLISQLAAYSKKIPPNTHEKAAGILREAVQRFGVTNFLVPEGERMKLLLLGKVREMLVALADAGAPVPGMEAADEDGGEETPTPVTPAANEGNPQPGAPA